MSVKSEKKEKRKEAVKVQGLPFPVYEFRPLGTQGIVYRYADGKWIEDDGEYDLAFIAPLQNRAYHVFLPYYKNIRWSWCKNMQWGAHVEEHPKGNAWHYMTSDGKDWGDSWRREQHPNRIADDASMQECAKRCGCASGSGPEFHVPDEYIAKGLLRERDTKKIIVPPKIFKCIYCGDIDWRKEDAKEKK